MATRSVPACQVRTVGGNRVRAEAWGGSGSVGQEEAASAQGWLQEACRPCFLPGGLGGRAQEEMVHTAARVPGRTPSLGLGFRCRSRSRSQMKL